MYDPKKAPTRRGILLSLAGFVLLLGLMVVMTYKDILRIFR